MLGQLSGSLGAGRGWEDVCGRNAALQLRESVAFKRRLTRLEAKRSRDHELRRVALLWSPGKQP